MHLDCLYDILLLRGFNQKIKKSAVNSVKDLKKKGELGTEISAL